MPASGQSLDLIGQRRFVLARKVGELHLKFDWMSGVPNLRRLYQVIQRAQGAPERPVQETEQGCLARLVRPDENEMLAHFRVKVGDRTMV